MADVTKTAEPPQGQETQIHADAGYTGVEKRPEIVALKRKLDWQIAGKRSVIQALAKGAQGARKNQDLGAGRSWSIHSTS